MGSVDSHAFKVHGPGFTQSTRRAQRRADQGGGCGPGVRPTNGEWYGAERLWQRFLRRLWWCEHHRLKACATGF
jgi:hypothetical protein